MKNKSLQKRIWSFLASHSDNPIIVSMRNAVHLLATYLHAENHDFLTNGEAYLLKILGADAKYIIDVGANRGEWTLMAHSLCSNATIYCFEISTETRKLLIKKIGEIQKIYVMDYGLADSVKTEKVKYYPKRDAVTSLYDFPHSDEYVWTNEQVCTGDIFMRTHNVEYIDLLKIDTEGADFRVLKGFDSAISKGIISVIQFEYGFACILSRKLLIDFYDYFDSKGYLIGKLHAKGVDFRSYKMQDENFFGPNYVAIHKCKKDIISRLAINK